MQYKAIITGSEPLTVEEVKAYLKVDYTKEDDIIAAQISAARSLIEKLTNRSLVAKTITLFDNEYVTSPYLLPFPAHDTVNSVEVNGVSVDVSTEGLTQLYVLFNECTYSNTYTRGTSLKVEYTTLGEVDEFLKESILSEIADLYEQRGSFYEGALTEISYKTMLKLQPYITV